MFSCGPRLKLGTKHRCPSLRYRFTRFRDLCFSNNPLPWLEGGGECLIAGRKRRTGYTVRLFRKIRRPPRSPLCPDTTLFRSDEAEDGAGVGALGDPVRAAGM